MPHLVAALKKLSRTLWELTTRPSSAITERDHQRMARIGSAALLALFFIGVWVQLVYWAFRRYIDALDWITVGVIALLGLGYLLSRTRYYRWAISINILLIIAGVFAIALLDYRPGNEQMLYYLVVPILLSTIFYKTRFTILLAALTTICLALLPVVVPSLPFDLIPLFFFITVVMVIVLGAHYRNQLEGDRQAALRASEARYRQLVNLSPDGIVIHRKGLVIFTNPAMVDMLGLQSQSQLMFQNLLHFVSPNLQETAQQWFEQPISVVDDNVFALPLLELEFCHREGQLVQTEVLQLALPAQSHPTALLMIRDVSERNRIAARLREAQKMEWIGRLAGGVAHDFNNLLTIISNYATIAVGDVAPDSRTRQDLEHIQTAAQKAAELVQQLLTFSRLQYTHPRRVNLNTLLNKTKPFLVALLPSKPLIHLHFQLTDDLGLCYIDTEQFERLVVNLVSNACDALVEGGDIYLSTKNVELDHQSALTSAELPSGSYITLSVRDTGVGIPPEILPNIMEPFFTTKEVGEGTGLGLATCFGIAKLNEGHIEVRSQVGVGSEFVVYLPRLIEPIERSVEPA